MNHRTFRGDALAACIAGATLFAAPTVGTVAFAVEAPATAPTAATTALATAPATLPIPPGLSRFPTFGVALAPPAGWRAIPNDKDKTVAQWVGADSTADDQKSRMTIEAGVVIGPSLEQVASKLAINFNGEVLEQATTLDGERALRVRAVPEEEAMAPVEGLVCMHGDELYLIMGGVAGGEAGGRVGPCREEVEAMRKSWKWIEFEPAVKNLAFRDKPLEAFGGSVTINAPAVMHVKAADAEAEAGDAPGPERLHLSLYDLRKGKAQFSAFVELAQMPPELTFEQVKAGFLQRMTAKAQMTPAPAWQDRGGVGSGRSPRVVTQCVEAGLAGAAPDTRKYLQWSLIDIGNGRLVLLNFTHTADTEEDRKVYEAVATQIVDSVAAGKVVTPTTTPAR